MNSIENEKKQDVTQATINLKKVSNHLSSSVKAFESYNRAIAIFLSSWKDCIVNKYHLHLFKIWTSVSDPTAAVVATIVFYREEERRYKRQT